MEIQRSALEMEVFCAMKIPGCMGSCTGKRLYTGNTCYRCQFACAHRSADITIGDWWGDIDALSGVDEHKGISVFICNTQKGKKLLEGIKRNMILKQIDLQESLKENPTLNHPTVCPPRSSELWKDFYKMKDKAFLKKYARPETKIYFLWLISRVIPKTLREFIKGEIRK